MNKWRACAQAIIAMVLAVYSIAPASAVPTGQVPTGNLNRMPQLLFLQEQKTGDTKRSPEVSALEQKLETAIQSEDYELALECARRLCEVSQNTPDLGSNSTAGRLFDYGRLLMYGSDYVAARVPLEQALRVLDAAAPGVAGTALHINVLMELGLLSSFIGDYQKGIAVLTRAVSMASTYGGADKNRLEALANLRLGQSLVSGEGDRKRALPLYEKALNILSSDKSAEAEELMDCLINLSALVQSEKKYAESISYLERALKISAEVNGENHRDTAVILNNMGMVYRDQEKFDQSLPLLERALRTMIGAMGPNHVAVATVYASLADVKYLQGDKAGAAQDLLKGARIVNEHVFDELPAGQSLAEQEVFLRSTLQGQVSLLLSACREGKSLSDAYEVILNWKGLLVEALRQQKVISALAQDERGKALVDRLRSLRSEISGWYQMAGNCPYDDWKKTYDELSSAKEESERALTRLSIAHSHVGFKSMTLSELKSALKPDEAFVDIFEYVPFGRTALSDYVAIVYMPSAAVPVRLVELGSVRDSALAIALWRNEVFANHEAPEQWEQLKLALWKPIGKALPANVKRVFLCPDGELSRLPWQLLCGSTNGGVLLTEMDSARQFQQLRQVQCCEDEKPTLLIAGGIDFNANPYGAAATQPAIVKLPALPGTLAEIKSIEKLAATDHIQVEEFSGANATKSNILKNMAGASYIHLATHGFFFDHNYVSAMKAIHEEQNKGKRGVSVMPSFRPVQQTRLRSPLVESGIAVSGANVRDPKSASNLGYISAEEFVGLNLDRCRMMTLSACETGRGQEVTGQGVLGLRSAIMSCGVRSILMSVWKVSDESTTRLMNEFYSNLWIKHMNKAEALRQAQLSMQKDSNPNVRLPINWGAWVLVGEGW